ncbi:hypothetical protein M0R45_029410 [Rubus argutus]|uniref:Uncharacterized protein n=1 Tax=Rubus argutus TaxID=59490 RepID=A0AAW1W830_RUBAR
MCFSYGAVVLEVASGRRPIEKEVSGVGKAAAYSNLVEWVWSLHREGRLLMAADPRLEGQFDEAEMRKVLLLKSPIVPRTKPTTTFSTSYLLLSLQDSVSDCNGMITISTSSSGNSFNGDDHIV